MKMTAIVLRQVGPTALETPKVQIAFGISSATSGKMKPDTKA